jgi:ribosome production factor 1
MTTSYKPKAAIYNFLMEVKSTIPNLHYYPRKNYTIPEIQQYAINKGYTELMVIREHRR